jgi:hypothetical protein
MNTFGTASIPLHVALTDAAYSKKSYYGRQYFETRPRSSAYLRSLGSGTVKQLFQPLRTFVSVSEQCAIAGSCNFLTSNKH